MLAIKSALAHKDATPLLVFDEIDANVGGEVARAVGFKMQQLGNRHQVISITHFRRWRPGLPSLPGSESIRGQPHHLLPAGGEP